jgi:hypothetical protein
MECPGKDQSDQIGKPNAAVDQDPKQRCALLLPFDRLHLLSSLAAGWLWLADSCHRISWPVDRF